MSGGGEYTFHSSLSKTMIFGGVGVGLVHAALMMPSLRSK
jgi:hypothetical protein